MSKNLLNVKLYVSFILAFSLLSFSMISDDDIRDADLKEAQKHSQVTDFKVYTPPVIQTLMVGNTTLGSGYNLLDTLTLTANPNSPNNGGAANWAIFFDLVGGAQELSVVQMNTASTATAGATFSVEIFTRSGTALGGPVGSGPGSSSAGWTSLGTVSVLQGPVNAGMSEIFNIPAITVPAGDTVGVAVKFTGAGPRYYGTGTPPYSTYSDANVSLTTGDARSVPFTPSGSFFSSREFCGSIRYFVNAGPSGVYCEDFESFTVGGRLACQDSVNWTTWSGDPCNTTEDPLISNTQSFSPTKSVVITQNNDLVKPLNNDTTGIQKISFKFYVPTGKAGYFNTLATFDDPTFHWGMECYFDVGASGNNGRLFGGSSVAVPFSYAHDTWQSAALIVNLDIDSAKFIINDNVIHVWKWSAGANGNAVPKRLAANDFFGATAVDELYVDDYCFDPNSNWTPTGVTPIESEIPSDYKLGQNYPNPFNPNTTINFTIPNSGLVTLKVYDVLGKEVATLVNGELLPGKYEYNFNAAGLSSGIYFYVLHAGDFIATKKMTLLK